ncbi:hypothetical protein LIER_00148 [Lithospermum erythrorhizon]|uniref:Protein kinase domain-containing protein n=1 Tax=Lithospermum erythrorhizon TaxID=34254 RepID=A0AAV3NKV3_LITER
MNLDQKSGKDGNMEVVKRVVVVAVKAWKEVSRTAIVWALTHVVQPGDCVKLVVVIPAHISNQKRWSFPIFNSNCTASRWRSLERSILDKKDLIADSCSDMMIQLQDVYDPEKIMVKIKVVSGTQCGSVAAEAKRSKANWVVFDKRMKKEAKICLDHLDCNVVVMKKSQPKVLRLNLIGSPNMQSEVFSSSELLGKSLDNSDMLDVTRVPNVTPASSPEHTPSTTRGVGTASVSSLDLPSSPRYVQEVNWQLNTYNLLYNERHHNYDDSDSDSDGEKLSPSICVGSQHWMTESLSFASVSLSSKEGSRRSNSKIVNSPSRAFTGQHLPELNSETEGKDDPPQNFTKNVREMVSLNSNSPPGPPPLCSICRHKAPAFGKPPRWFSYAELEYATDGFSQANFIAEGGYGTVHHGVLPDGQVVAVKQHKLASTQGDLEFCSEVEVLSCAQHRNVVMLIGFCVEDKRRLLVYEYICNGSLDGHLYVRGRDPLDWPSRQNVAIGAARGLRYLHEECRVGCIIHRDMRPNNILLTHDFEPLVGDFGLARWQPDGDLGVETRIIGTFGYLAPEYAQTGEITEKSDVYSFGVVLVELVTGRKAVDMTRPKGQQFLTEWARPLLEQHAIAELVDPLLGNSFSESEVSTMIHCCSLCLRRDAHARPRMSQVLRMLEGDNLMS